MLPIDPASITESKSDPIPSLEHRLRRLWLDYGTKMTTDELTFLRENVVVRLVHLTEEQVTYANELGKKYSVNW